MQDKEAEYYVSDHSLGTYLRGILSGLETLRGCMQV